MTNLHPLIERARQKGVEREYLDWLRKWPDCLTGIYSHWEDGVGYNEPAHIRHVSHGSGTGIKPEYWAVPLTHDQHHLTHAKGDSVFYPADFWDEKAAWYLCQWINGANPPEPAEEKTHWKREYIITSAGHVLAIWLMVKKFFSIKKDGAVKITVQRVAKARTTKQNSLQWSQGLYGYQLDFYKQNPMAFMRDSLAALSLRMQAGKLTKDDVHEMNKWLHNKGKSTAKLSTMESSAYHDAIRAHHLEMDNIEFPEIISPNQFNQGDYQ
jgi:hypothetical protein